MSSNIQSKRIVLPEPSENLDLKPSTAGLEAAIQQEAQTAPQTEVGQKEDVLIHLEAKGAEESLANENPEVAVPEASSTVPDNQSEE